MSVYVDDMFAQATVPNGAGSVKGKWCHMTADTREELDAMADKIGLRRSWIQYPGTWKEHYDVTESRRAAAVREGAVEVSMRDGVIASRERWEAKQNGWGTYSCAHCGLTATQTTHDEGSHRGKQRCGLESGLPYGYNAHPANVPCDNSWTACIGSVTPVPRSPE